MSVREALINDLQNQPETVVKEMRDHLDFLIEKHRHQKNGQDGADSFGWPKGYFDEVAGAFANERFERSPQG
jgi:hypothetical protein